MTELWLKRREETSRAFGVFQKFLQMGTDRTLINLAQQVGRSISQINKWSGSFEWFRRAAAYDDHLATIAVKAAEKARIEMAERQIQMGQYLQGMAKAGIRKLFDENGRLLPNVELTPTECARLIEIGVKVERLARGENTDSVRQEHSGEVKVVRFPLRATSREEWAANVQAATEPTS